MERITIDWLDNMHIPVLTKSWVKRSGLVGMPLELIPRIQGSFFGFIDHLKAAYNEHLLLASGQAQWLVSDNGTTSLVREEDGEILKSYLSDGSIVFTSVDDRAFSYEHGDGFYIMTDDDEASTLITYSASAWPVIEKLSSRSSRYLEVLYDNEGRESQLVRRSVWAGVDEHIIEGHSGLSYDFKEDGSLSAIGESKTEDYRTILPISDEDTIILSIPDFDPVLEV